MADETKVTSPLTMDRTEPLGNSEDVDGRRALHVLVRNNAGQPIPVNVSFAQGFGNLSPGYPKQAPVTDTSSLILPANPNRIYAHIFNNSKSPIWIQWQASATVGEGIKINPSSLYTLSGFDLWLGDVNAIAGPSITVDIDITEAIV